MLSFRNTVVIIQDYLYLLWYLGLSFFLYFGKSIHGISIRNSCHRIRKEITYCSYLLVKVSQPQRRRNVQYRRQQDEFSYLAAQYYQLSHA